MKQRYMLDTDICIYIINHRPAQVREKLLSIGENACGISAITASELAFGSYKSGREDNKIRLNQFLTLFEIFPYTDDVMWHYAQVRHTLQSKGKLIGSNDMLIASHALALDLTLITNNTDEFERVPNLKLENWV